MLPIYYSKYFLACCCWLSDWEWNF